MILAIPPSKLRKWMLVAYDEQMVSGDYVFIFIDVETPSSDVRDDWLSKKMWRDGDGRNDNALTAFSNVLVVSTSICGTYSYDMLLFYCCCCDLGRLRT